MRKNGFTLIELLAVIVILAIIALIATPIILNIINDARKESQERSVELYASAIRNGIAAYQLREMKEVAVGSYTSETLPFDVEYDGDVECSTIELYEDGALYVTGCTVNELEVEYTYGTKQIPQPVSFSTDDWYTIIENVKAGNLSAYNVGDTKEISLTGFTNKDEGNEAGTYTIRIANMSTPGECSNEGFSQTACGFVIEFGDIITTYNIDADDDGWETSSTREYINSTIYESLPEILRNNINDTTVISGSSDGKGVVTTTDKIYLLSEKETPGSETNDSSSSYSRQLDYYSSIGVTKSSYDGAIKKLDQYNNHWCVRSIVRYVRSTGVLATNKGDYPLLGISVAFRIG